MDILFTIFSFIYKESFQNGLTEYEYDHVFFGNYSSDPILNPEEASEFKWIKINDLKNDIDENPNRYTAWLKIMFTNYFNGTHCNCYSYYNFKRFKCNVY